MTTKELETLRARCAFAGVAFHAIEDDRGQPMYAVSRWNLSRTFATVAEVDAWLERVTGVRVSAGNEGAVS